MRQGSHNIAGHQCDAHRCILRCVEVSSKKKLCIRVRIENEVQCDNLGNIFRLQNKLLRSGDNPSARVLCFSLLVVEQ